MATYTAQQRYTAHTEDMPWQCAPTPGISFKSLRFDPETGQGAVLIHMTPNSVYPRHTAHDGLDVLVVDGEVLWDGQKVARGGFIHLPPGTQSEPRTANGCVLYATFNGKVENLHQGWNPRAAAGD